MLKIVTEKGTELPIDDSKIDYDKERLYLSQQVTLIDDQIYLESVWIVYLWKNKNENHLVHTNLEYVTEKVFYHEPSENELIYFMAANGARVHDDFVTIDKGYVYNIHYD